MSSDDGNGTNRPLCNGGTNRQCPNRSVKASRGKCKKHYRAWRDVNQPVPGEVATAYLQYLRDNGLGYRRIQQLSGLSMTTIRDIATSNRVYIEAPTGEKLFAIRPDRTLTAQVDAVGLTRRVRALAAIGFTDVEIAAAAGMRQCNLWKYFSGTAVWARRDTYVRMDAGYRQLVAQSRPVGWVADRARRRAVNRGWAPPSAWVEGSIDDPKASPAAWLFNNGDTKVLPADWLAVVVDRRQLGRTDEAIAAEFGMDVESLHRRFDRAGLPRHYGRLGIAS